MIEKFIVHYKNNVFLNFFDYTNVAFENITSRFTSRNINCKRKLRQEVYKLSCSITVWITQRRRGKKQLFVELRGCETQTSL